MTCFGVPVFIWAARILYILDHNSRARLSGSLTEENIFIIAIIGLLLAVIGILLVIFAKVKRKNKEFYDSIENSTKQNYCTHCHTNVNAKNGICPICNRKIGG